MPASVKHGEAIPDASVSPYNQQYLFDFFLVSARIP